MSKWYVLLLKSKITFFFAIIGEYSLIKTISLSNTAIKKNLHFYQKGEQILQLMPYFLTVIDKKDGPHFWTILKG